MEQAEYLPLPYFKINKNLDILSMSDKAKQLFMIGDGFLSLVDEESMEKARSNIYPEIVDNNVELNLKTKNNPSAAYEVNIHWNSEDGHIICFEAPEKTEKITDQLQKLRDRLNSTDFELLAKKEELEDAIERVNKLSGPVIPLDEDVALVPFFGDLPPEKLDIIKTDILRFIYDSSIDYLLFDFTAVGNISREGINSLEELMNTIHLMGQEIVLCGVKPKHAQAINNLRRFLKAKTVTSLSQAIHHYFGGNNK
ncbi:STAS domain-containing protein [Virgibacillus senegalensis]|uniref:STAS domain-containing protein n=1 Tax=Virgibacillus senegalensis TaxID=1499679 RepID=UPI00069D1CEB|nr:STAS domain-containing protein [Virgibacillus senegalensis]